jgi:hypothetical protein
MSERLEIGTTYRRDAIPPLFGEPYNGQKHNQGSTIIGRALVLFVTIDKQGMSDGAEYRDRFDGDRFRWTSQNRTGKTGRIADAIRGELADVESVQLFWRQTKRDEKGKTRGFTYAGPLVFESWRGEKPLRVVFRMVAA